MGEISKFNPEKLTRQRPTRRAWHIHGGRWRISIFEQHRKPRWLLSCPVPQLITDLERGGGVQSLRLPDGLVDRFSPIKKLGPDLTSGSINAKNNAGFSNAESIVSNQRVPESTHVASLARIEIIKCATKILSDSRMKCLERFGDLEGNLHARIAFKST